MKKNPTQWEVLQQGGFDKKKSTKRQELKENRVELLANYVSMLFSPRYRHEWSAHMVTDPDGTAVQAKVLKRGSPHPGLLATEGLRQLIQPIPKALLRDWVSGKASPELNEKLNTLYREHKDKVLAGLRVKDPQPLLLSINHFGPRLLLDPEMNAVVERWWLALLDEDQEEQQIAKRNMEGLCAALQEVGQGRWETLNQQEKQQIVEECKKWLPLSQQLNGTFKRLWYEKQYQTSERFRKEARGRLAERHGIPITDVEAIESYLKKSSHRSKKSTPTQAMCRMVARYHFVGEKTVESIWNKYKRKASTTPAAEKTA